jgi:Protein of unknown function (DUF1549)/Protein of unknown function (DUF1553)
MKSAKSVLVLTIFSTLSLIGGALPQQPEPTQQVDQDRIEAAHGQLMSGKDNAADASRLTQTVAPVLPDTAAAYAAVPRKNFVDEYIFGRIERDKIPHSPVAGDAEFLRRTYLDAIGLLPTADQVRAFLADPDPNKRDKLIDSLIGTEEFTDQWAYQYDELLRTRMAPFHVWTKQWLKVDRPYNEVFYDLVTVSTKSMVGQPVATGFYDTVGYIANRCVTWYDPDDYKHMNRLDFIDEITSDIGRVFLGLSMDCFSCHNGAGHADSFNMFLGSQKRTDFWQQAAFFGKVRDIGGPGSNGATASSNLGRGSLDDLAPGYTTGDDGPFYTPAEGRFPRDGRTYQPAFILTGEKPKPGEDPRKALGRILPSHIQFARAAVNIVWQRLMVVGLVEPYDGFDLKRLDPKNPPPAPWTIQPANPELLEALAEDFRTHNYSIHRVIKTIMKSNAYQLSTAFPGQWKDAYIPYYARRFARVLTPPETVDVLTQATDVPYTLQQKGEAKRYVKELTNPLNMSIKPGEFAYGAISAGTSSENPEVFSFMQAYYQAERAMPPVDKNVTSPVQAMMMMSSKVVTKRVSAEGQTRVAKLLKSGKSDEEMIEDLFLSSVTRLPTPDEVTVAKRLIAEDRKGGTETIQWSLLNCGEFLTNH